MDQNFPNNFRERSLKEHFLKLLKNLTSGFEEDFLQISVFPYIAKSSYSP